MGSTSYPNRSKSAGYRGKAGSSIGSDKDISGRQRRIKIRRPGKMNEYGLKRVPDYTELAYKEAVSKLRYFLSGNYAPSIRSYIGTPSIKNLDESDGDLDKKYSVFNSPVQVNEFKPRPRLTAKYATLYADSLKNYQQPNNVAATSSPGADLSGGTNPDVINFIQKQEEYIEQLERESQYCRDELNNLLGKVKEVISENENLHEAQKNRLISKMFHTYNAGSETDDLDDLGDSTTGLDSDNKVTPSKIRKSGKNRSTRLEGPNIVFESRIAELEAQLAQSKIDLKKLQDENNDNKRKLASGLVDSTCLDGFKRQIDNLQRDKSALEAQISKLKVSLDMKDNDLEGRYKRGSDATELQLREERNNLEAEVRRLKEEVANERSRVRELAGEGARRALSERSAAERRYAAHCDQLQRDLAQQHEHVAKLHLEMERQRRDENELKREISIKNSTIEELKMELKNKTASLQADLAQAHAEKASLEEELASARLSIERHQRQSKHETNRLNSEIQSLRQRLDRADADLVHSRRENLRLSEQIATLEKEMNMNNLSAMSPEKKKDKELSTALESIESRHAKTVAELESMIQSQNSLMEKLTGECRLLTDKLDDANRRHKEELATLQRQVENLGRSLQTPPPPAHSTQKAPTAYTNFSDRNRYAPPDIRPNNSGADTAGLPTYNNRTDGDVRDDGVNDTNNPTVNNDIGELSNPKNYHPQSDANIENFENDANKIQNEEDGAVTEKQEFEQPEYAQNYNEGNYENYGQTYEPNQIQSTEFQNQVENSDYPNQGYENYQLNYNQQQYQNYEQYPQEYGDPSQSTEQYNYPVDENYQNYETTASEPKDNQDYQQYQEQTNSNVENVETLQTNNSPNQNLSNIS